MTAPHDHIDHEHLRAALTEFDAIWDVLMPHEKGRLIQSVIERVVCAGTGDVQVTFLMPHLLKPDSE